MAEKVAGMEMDKDKVDDMEVDNVADMGVDKVANMVVKTDEMSQNSWKQVKCPETDMET